MEYGEGFDKDHVAGLDQKIVELAWGGKAWGKEDQARYDKMAMDGSSADTTPDDSPVEDKPATTITPVSESKPTVDNSVTTVNPSIGSGAAAQGLLTDYVGAITNQNTATNTGDINVSGNNYGTNNTGIMDYSVNISGDGPGFSNMKAAQAYNAMNENQYERSRSKMTGASRASKAVQFAEDQIKAASRRTGLDRATDSMSEYYRSQAGKYNTFAFGDYLSPNYRVPTFTPPADPKEIKVNYKEDKE